MERKIREKLSSYESEFKQHVQKSILNSGLKKDKNDYKALLETIFGFKTLELTEQDFKKRKRIKNTVPLYSRCEAKRANSLRCTRRKKNDSKFCGTHIKGCPHGVISDKQDSTVKKIAIYSQEIQGIQYNIDDYGNVYDPVDIINNNKNPKIIAKYKTKKDEKDGSIIYSIPSIFGD